MAANLNGALGGKRVVEDITVPGMIVSRTAAAKEPNRRIRIKHFSLGSDDDPSSIYALEELLNNEDIILIDYHKYTNLNTFHVVITYDEPVKGT